MKTDDLVTMLANGVEAADPRMLEKRFALALAIGLSGAAILMLTMLGIRRDLAQVLGTPLFWVKLGFSATVLGGALSVTARLARPGRRAGPGGLVIAGALAALWLGGIAILAVAPPALRPHLILGNTWRVCTVLVTMLALPAFGALFWALRGMAPTQPRLAGAAAGLLAGAQGLLVYCLHCPESAPPFWAVWYVLGLAVPTALGAAVGKSALRW